LARVTNLGKIVKSNEVKIFEAVSPGNVAAKYFEFAVSTREDRRLYGSVVCILLTAIGPYPEAQ
jgi:hypothetical protein